jgi:hypothetical protein
MIKYLSKLKEKIIASLPTDHPHWKFGAKERDIEYDGKRFHDSNELEEYLKENEKSM